MNKFTLVLNAGRSGSSFIENILKANYSDQLYLAHEDIPVQVSKPRLHNRAYTQERIDEVLSDEKLVAYISKWQAELEKRPIVETGWTVYHLCPVLLHLFKDRFQVILMHRDPISFAFSRANMGNYHSNTFYDNAHEVSPNDKYSIAPEKKDVWNQMNHFEKCMYWWWVVYKEGLEFFEIHPEVPQLEVKSTDIFSFKRMDEVLEFLHLDPSQLKERDVHRNPLAKFMRESFPIEEEWKAYKNHPDILKFAEELGGYTHTDEKLEKMAEKYKLPSGFGAKIRNKIRYWKLKSKVRSIIDN